MSKINTPPRGLQFLVGNTNQGVNPSELMRDVRPGIDLLPFWSVDNLQTRSASGVPAGVIGQGINLFVPNGEAWMLVAASVSYFAALNDTRAISLAINDPSGGQNTVVAKGEVRNATGATEIRAAVQFPRPFILPSSWSFRGQVDESTNAGGSTMIIRAIVHRLIQ